MSRLIAFIAVAIGAAVLAGSAGADRPVRTFLPADDLVLAGICPFDVELTFLANEEFETVFSDGRTLITGTLKARLTNLASGNSIDVNISGPGVITETADTFEVKAEGRWLFFFFPGDLGPGSAGVLVLTSGLAFLRGDASGLSFTPARNTTDVCAALA